MPFSRSRSIESMTRSLTSWFARKAPDCQSILSTRVVLPWSTWATIATLRRSSRTAIGGSFEFGGSASLRAWGMLPPMTTAWDDAVAAVRGGADADGGRRPASSSQMTDDERQWCLDGDIPFWAGLADLGTGGYHRRPFLAARVERLGIPGFAFSDGPRGVVDRQRHLLPGHDGPRRHVGRRPRGAHRRRHRPGAARRRRRPLRRRVREPAPPPGLGSGPGDLRRGPAPRRRDGRRPHPRRPAPRDGHGEALRVQLDGERPLQGRRHRRRAGAARGVPPPLQADRRRGRGLRDERLQRRERRVVRREPHAAHRRSSASEWGFDGFVISDWIFGLRDAGHVGQRRARRRDARSHGPLRAASTRRARGRRGHRRRHRRRASTRTVAAMLRHATDPARDRSPVADERRRAARAHRALAREAAAKAIVLLRNEPVDGAPLLPLDAAIARGGSRCSGALADERNLGDGGSSDVCAPTVVTHLDGLRAALPGAEVRPRRRRGSRRARARRVGRRRDRGRRLHPRRRGRVHRRRRLVAPHARSCPAADEPDVVGRLRGPLRRRPRPRAPTRSPGERRARLLHRRRPRARSRCTTADEALIAAVAAATPADRRGRSSPAAPCSRRPGATHVPAIAAGLVRRHGGRPRASPTSCSATSTPPAGCRSRCPPTRPTCRPSTGTPTPSPTTRWHGYWRLARDRHEPAFPFGFGLSYTTWVLGPTDASTTTAAAHRSAALHNTGDRAGADVLQVYAGRTADTTRPARRLVAFARHECPPAARSTSCCASRGRSSPCGSRRTHLGGRCPAPTSSPSAATRPI